MRPDARPARTILLARGVLDRAAIWWMRFVASGTRFSAGVRLVGQGVLDSSVGIEVVSCLRGFLP